MKKIFLMFFIILFFFPLCSFASDNTDSDFSVEIGQETVSAENAASFLSPKKIIDFSVKTFSKLFSEKSGFILKMLAVTISAWLITTLAETSLSEKLMTVMSFAVGVSSSLWTFSEIADNIFRLTSSFDELSGLLTSLIPAFLVSVASSGFPSAASAGGSVLMFVFELISVLIGSVVLPFANTYLCLGIASGISENSGLKDVSSFVRNFTVALLGIIIIVFCGIMSIQTTVALTADSMTKRAAKLAVGTFIPIFGGTLSDGLETAFASYSVMSSSLGVFGTVSVFFSLAVPVIDTAVNLFTVSVTCSVCSLFDNNPLLGFLSAARDCLVVLLASEIAVIIMLTAGLGILININI